MSEAPHIRLMRSFRERVAAGALPGPRHNLNAAAVGITPERLVSVFESQLMSRHLDYAARRLGEQKRGFYSIGSAGHEGNAAVASVLRPTDIAFLHYRSGAFLIERQKQQPGSTPLWDMALSFVASSEDPVSGGRHKVLGSHALKVPPQTSTIASHLPKAVGAAFSIPLARLLNADFAELPFDALALVSFGDASANHSTAQGALNGAALTAYRRLSLPLIFLCEDNGIGISVPTPGNWIAANYANRPGLHYLHADGTEILEVLAVAQEAAQIARQQRKPVFLHLEMVRLMGHAGSDVESAYRPGTEIEAAEAADPLLKTARTLIDEGILAEAQILEMEAQIAERVNRITELASARPKLTSAAAVMRSILPGGDALLAPLDAARDSAPGSVPGSARDEGQDPAHNDVHDKAYASVRESSLVWSTATAAIDRRATVTPQHLSRLISLTLAGILANDPRALVFGEDVGRKGGVYGATTRLQGEFGLRRVFDTHLDEQSILGLAIGLAHNGFVPLPEIQFLAYVHNAEDQIRGEAATLSFFSDGRAANPMVIRIAGLAYQRGFGGHFHNDNAIAVFRDIPGLVLATPSRGDDAVGMLRTCYRLAREQGRVVVFLEPIALYSVKDLYEEGDGLMSFSYEAVTGEVEFGRPGVEGGEDGDSAVDVAIVSYANGAYLSRRARRTLEAEGISSRLIDLRWLNPLPVDAVHDAIGAAQRVLIVDECRRTASPSEELITGLIERGLSLPLARITAEDSFIPLGAAAYEVLPSEDRIVARVRQMMAATTADPGGRKPATGKKPTAGKKPSTGKRDTDRGH
ncbi:MAG: thiamine pyrophosphate-dependent enzyme [Pseudomonadales bacterium]|nr:hypothetical protein [Pseudomonadales bacterium]